MPLYEYVCETDGAVIELLRSMSDADMPAEDPEGKGRTFVRKLSTFAAKTAGSSTGSSGGSSLPMAGGCCPCGKNRGQCSA